MMNSSCQYCGAVRHHRQHDAQEGVDADLREHAREQRQHGDRGGAVGLRHPAVEREERRLHEERKREQQHDPVLGAPPRSGAAGASRQRERDLAAVRRGEHSERDRRGHHQQRSRQRVDHELGRRAHALAAAPAADQEVERHEHQVEEDDEEREVLRHEGAEHRSLRKSQVEEEEARPLHHGERGHQRARHPGDRGQGDHEQVEPVDAELVADAELRNPLVVRDPLEPAARLEVDEHDHHVGEHRQRAGQHRRARPGGAAAAPRRGRMRSGRNSTMDRWMVTSC